MFRRSAEKHWLRQVAGLLGVWSILLTAGCTTTELLDWRTWKKPEIPQADKDHPAVRIVALWEPSEGIGLDKLPTRGFAGQILFFIRGSSSPVAVKGKVRIYVYDDQGPAESRLQPIHQFDFPSESWAAHLITGMLGPSYHVFIPYTRKHPYRAQCSLRVRLTPEEGPVIYSELVHVTLPGPTRERRPTAALELESGEAHGSAQPADASSAEPFSLGASIAHYRIPLRTSSTGATKNGKPALGRPRSPATGGQQSAVEQSLSTQRRAALAPPPSHPEPRQEVSYEARLQEIAATVDELKRKESATTASQAQTARSDSRGQRGGEQTPSRPRFRLAPAEPSAHPLNSQSDSEQAAPHRHPLADLDHPLSD